MDISQLRYLIALARERHFARAAKACSVTQPTLSARIRQLEEELGVPIVLRGNRFQGLTPEGERLLAWAHRHVADWDSMRQELRLAPEDIEGRLTLGVIPSALPRAPGLLALLRQRHPRIRAIVLSRSSTQIRQDLADFQIDAGISYLEDSTHGAGLLGQPLYSEGYCLYVAVAHPLATRASVDWAEAAALPLCALTPDMQNRRFVDAAFARLGKTPSPEIESNSVIHLLATVAAGRCASVLPECHATLLGEGAGVRAVPLGAPQLTQTVGLVALQRDPAPPLVAALFAAARDWAPTPATEHH